MYIEDFAQRFPKYKSRFYVATRNLPLELNAEIEYQLVRVLQDAPGHLTPSECLEERLSSGGQAKPGNKVRPWDGHKVIKEDVLGNMYLDYP